MERQEATAWVDHNDAGKSRKELLAELSNLRRQREEATSTLAAIVQFSFDAIIGIGKTLDGFITVWNPGAERAYGYTAAEAIGQPLSIVLPPERRAEFDENMRTIRQGRVVPPHRTQRRHKNGRLTDVLVTIFPIKNDANEVTGAASIAQDLTEILGLERRFSQAQKIEAVGQLAGGVAHDFNNLLTIINGYSELLLSRLGPQDPMRDLLGEIYTAGERAGTLTRQLLAFSRQQVLEPKVLDLNSVVSETHRMLARLIGEDIILTHKPEPRLGPVKVDPGQMQQVLMNLAVNARDAMPRGGRLTMETANVRLDENYTRTRPYVRPGAYSMLAVSDTGVGMDEQTKAHIYEPFFTTKEPGKGTGLGLAMVYGIVKQSGGSIEVYSEPGRGTTFKIYLPQVRERVSSGKSSPSIRLMPRGNETVLLAEDEDALRALVRHVLRSCGYTVLEATNGKEAIQFVESYDGPLHLLVSDVVMPHLGGRQLAERLTELRPTLRVLFLSGYTDDAVVRHGVLEADFAFLQKPFTTSGLAQKVREVLDAKK